MLRATMTSGKYQLTDEPAVMAAAAQERVRRQLLSASSRKERPSRQPTPPTAGHGQVRELPVGGRSQEP
eukprot:4999026-Pyramimonas_sp.AAC.1